MSDHSEVDIMDSQGVNSPLGPIEYNEDLIDCVKEDWHKHNRIQRKRIKRKMSKVRHKMKHQSGSESEATLASSIPEIIQVTKGFKDIFDKAPDFWTAVKSYEVLKYDTIFDYVEGIAQLLIILTDEDISTKSAIAALLLYAKTLVKDKSLSMMIGEFIETLFITPQGEDNTFIEAIRECRTNWKMFKNNKLFKKVSSLLTLLVSLGICEATNFEFSLGRMKVVEARAFEVQMSAMDMTDAILDTLAFFIEGGYRCYMVGSLKPLLYDDYKVYELEEEYITLCRMWDLQQNGNLLKIEGIQASEFDNRLEKALTQFKTLLGTFSGLDKKILSDKYTKLLQIKSDYVFSRLSGGTRRSPWVVELFGESCQGKTTVAECIIDRMLAAANLPLEETRRATLNASSKWMDTWKSDHLVAMLDDMCNEKSNFVEKPPTRWVIDLCNNQTFCAPKAEIEGKGKVLVEPEIVTISTNKKDLDSYAYSNCPYSIQRRAHIVATVRAKTLFQAINSGVECGLSTAKVNEYYETHERPEVEDLWDIDVEVAVMPKKLDETASYTPFIYKDREMTGISMNDFVEMNIDLFLKHREQQFEMLAQNDKRKNIEKCGIDGCPNVKSTCTIHSEYRSLPSGPAAREVSDDEEEEPAPERRGRFFNPRNKKRKNRSMKKQYGEQFAGAIHETVTNFKTKTDNEIGVLDGLATKGFYLAVSYCAAKWDWLQLVPLPVFEMNFVQDMCRYYAKEDIVRKVNICLSTTFMLAIFLSLSILYYGWKYYPVVIVLWLIVLLFSRNVYRWMERMALKEFSKRTKIMYPMLEKFKNDNYQYIIGISAIAFSIMALRCVYKSYVAIKPKQGNIVSPDEKDVKRRDTEVNPYCEAYRRALPIVGKGRTVSNSDLANILDKNLLYGSIKVKDKIMRVNALMVSTNYMILPSHYFDGGDTTMTCRRNNPDTLGGKYEVRLDVINTVNLPNSELKLVYVAEGGSYKNITELLIDDFPSDHCFNMKYRQYDGTFLSARGIAIANDKCNNGTVFRGVEYHNLTMDTFGGLCGAVLYSNGIGCNITGIHVGGVEDKPIGCASIPVRRHVMEAMDLLSKKLTCIKTADDCNFPIKQYGVEFLTDDKLHPKSPINYLPQDSTILYHGSCIGKTTSHSDVRLTYISDIVTEISGVPNKWQAPAMKPEWKGWQDCLANISEPSKSMPYELIEHCMLDYLQPLKDIMEEKPFWKTAKPLTNEENLLGVPGQKFMDAIKKNTSTGYPLTGPKTKHMIELEPTLEYPHNFEFTDEIMSEIDLAEEKYARGERAYPIAKACKKDEVLPKEKCRIFYGNAIHLTWLIRKYFLPLIRFLQMNPLLSECAVGINCHSKEWDQLYNYITKYDNLFGGDYKKYDQKLPAQLVICAFNILIELAKLCDYSDNDVRVMESMVADVVYAYIAVNGDLISLTSGTHISGNSLTVIINGICGALNLRACFYTHNPKEWKFRDYVALSTYGDDNIGSVGDCKFSIKLISEFLAQYGQEYTMPDKTSELKDYLGPDNFEFLKRTTVYHPEIDCHVGALQMDSIYKSLHMYMRGKSCENSEEEACALNLDTAMRECFNHGREVYEAQQVIMKQIADKSNLSAFCTELDVSYEERIFRWKEKYDPQSLCPSSDKTVKDPPRMTHGVVEAVEDVPCTLVTNPVE